jgi:flagellar basal body-associated protein FliL
VTVTIELINKGFKKEIDKKVSELRKEIINLVLTKSPKEVKSSYGKEILRREITSNLNKYLSKNCIKNTYFTELIIL